MTPPAASTAHARTVRRGAAPRGPRRVSGPSRAAGGARAARAAQAPVRVTTQAGTVALPRTHIPLAHRLGAVSESQWLDRLLRSRGWIGLLAALLIGLVFMQVSLLKLNAGMGSDVERAADLDRSNAMLRAEVSKLESNDRIQQKAIASGMVLPASNNVRYLGADGKRIGGANAAGVPSQAEASQALLPTAPAGGVEDGAPTVSETTAPGTVAEPQTTSSVPVTPGATATPAPAPATQTPVTAPAPAVAAVPATGAAPVTPAAAPTTATPPTGTTAAAPNSAAAGVAVGGAAAGG